MVRAHLAHGTTRLDEADSNLECTRIALLLMNISLMKHCMLCIYPSRNHHTLGSVHPTRSLHGISPWLSALQIISQAFSRHVRTVARGPSQSVQHQLPPDSKIVLLAPRPSNSRLEISKPSQHYEDVRSRSPGKSHAQGTCLHYLRKPISTKQ